MTGRERVLAAMERREADRVPFMCQLAIGHYLLHLEVAPSDLWLHGDTFADALVALAERYGMDGILINLPGRDPEVDAKVERVEQLDHGDEMVHYCAWPSPLVCPRADLPHHPEPPRLGIEELDPDRIYYEDPHTLGGLKYPFHYDLDGPVAADATLFPSYVTSIIDRVVEQVEGRLSVHSEVFSPFTQLMERLGYENGLMALLEHPDRCHALLARYAEGAGALGALQATRGVDAVLISSAFAGGGFISKAMYERFVLPYERTVAERIHEAGVKVYTHTCGHIGDRLELMAETGIDGVDTMDPPPLGDTDLADAKRRLGDRLFLKGNVDSVNVLLRGSRERVLETAREKLLAAAPGGGYILSSACSVAPAVPAENLFALAEAVETWGSYA